VYQGFGKVGWQNDKTDIDLSYTYADTSLWGNGATPRACWTTGARRATRRTSRRIFSDFVNLTGTQFLTDKLLLSGNAYYRRLSTERHQRQCQ
jgi:iron complex outermembrane receptor protein